MNRIVLIVILFFVSTIFSREHYIKGNFSYLQISPSTNDSIKFKADWGLEYNISIINRLYGTLGFDNAFWINEEQSSGTDYTSFIAGFSYDLIKKQNIVLNTGIGGGLLFHFYKGSGKDYYPHYYLNISSRFQINKKFGLGMKYSLSNGANKNIFKECINSVGLDASINLSKPINKFAEKWKIPENCVNKKLTGFNFTGYSLLYSGLVCSVVSIPFFIHAFEATPSSDIDFAIGMTLGSILLGTGTLFECGSIPFFVLHKKHICK